MFNFSFGKKNTNENINISVDDAVKKIGTTIFLDVRTKEEYDSGHVPESININFYDSSFTENVCKLNKMKEYIVYCQSGGRASKATRLMKKEGFDDVHNLEGGIKVWQSAGKEIEG